MIKQGWSADWWGPLQMNWNGPYPFPSIYPLTVPQEIATISFGQPGSFFDQRVTPLNYKKVVELNKALERYIL